MSTKILQKPASVVIAQIMIKRKIQIIKVQAFQLPAITVIVLRIRVGARLVSIIDSRLLLVNMQTTLVLRVIQMPAISEPLLV
jgi:hypothetical protein